MRSNLYDNTCALQVRMTAACPYPGYMGNLVCNGFLSVNCLNGCLTSSQVSSPTPGWTGKRVAGEPSQGDREQKNSIAGWCTDCTGKGPAIQQDCKNGLLKNEQSRVVQSLRGIHYSKIVSVQRSSQQIQK